MIDQAIKNLVEYGVETGLITTEDKVYTANRLLEILGLDEYSEPETATSSDLEVILKDVLSFAVENGIIDDNITEKDLLIPR